MQFLTTPRGIIYSLIFFYNLGMAAAQESQVFHDSVRALFNRGEWSRFAELAEAALPDTIRNDHGALSVSLLAKAHYFLGNNPRALSLYERLYSYSFQDTLYRFQFFTDFSQVLIETGSYARVEALFKPALAYLSRQQDTITYVRCLNFYGVLCFRTSRYTQAVEYLQKALALAQDLKSDIEAHVLTNLGIVNRSTGNYRQALEFYRRSLALSAERSNAMDMAVDYMNIGNVYNEIGDYRQALDHYRQSYECYASAGDWSGISAVLGNQSYAYLQLKQFDSAKNNLQKAIAIAQSVHDPLGEADWLFNLAEIYYEENQIDSCLTTLEVSAKLYRRLSRFEELAEISVAKGICHEDLNELDVALECFSEAIQSLLRHRLTKKIWLPLYQAARIRSRQGAIQQADSMYRAAIQALEASRDGLEDARLAMHFLEGERLDVYRSFAAWLMHSDSTASALSLLERSKSRSLSDWLKIDLEKPAPDSILCIEYFLWDDSVYAFLKSSKHTERLTLAELKNVNQIATEYVGMLNNRLSHSQQIERLSEKLYRYLIAPFETRLQNYKHLVIIPDGVLNFVPFETLKNDSTYLIETVSIRYAPSMAIFNHVALRSGELKSACIMAASSNENDVSQDGIALAPLPFAVKEQKKVTAILSDKIKVDTTGEFSDFSVLHFATHAINNLDKPEQSFLWIPNPLQNEPRLTVGEIEKMKLKTELVVLSACETASGQLLRGEGMLGLTRAFLAAGSRSVVSTAWKVNDAAAAFFMERFYIHWVESFDTAGALRSAKKDMIGHEEWRQPTFWGAFVLWGF